MLSKDLWRCLLTASVLAASGCATATDRGVCKRVPTAEEETVALAKGDGAPCLIRRAYLTPNDRLSVQDAGRFVLQECAARRTPRPAEPQAPTFEDENAATAMRLVAEGRAGRCWRGADWRSKRFRVPRTGLPAF